MESTAKTVTLAQPEGPDDPGVVQVTVDGQDWLLVAGRPTDNVPDSVVKVLDEMGVNYERGSGQSEQAPEQQAQADVLPEQGEVA